jgi:hypothetical protein
MKRSVYTKIMAVIIGLLFIPVMVHAQSGQAATEVPPIQQPLVREGDFAVKLVFALALGATDDEVESEDLLSSAGITPRNGWIADYPVTPDILVEIRESVLAAAGSQKLSMSQDEALKRFQDAKDAAGLEIRPYASGETHEINPGTDNYPNTSVINNYYYNQGPPIVTYYAPPPDYYYLYSWVPYPFWWYDFWFPGFFVLNDFHRVVIIHHRTVFVSNHFNDYKHHRVFRIDPVERFHGKTYAGIGAPRKGHYISPGIKKGAETIFNRNRTGPPSQVKKFVPSPRGKTIKPPSKGRTISPHPEGRTFRQPSGGRTVTPHPDGRTISPPSGGRSTGPPSGGVRSFSPPSGGGTVKPHSGGEKGSFGGGQRR